MTKCVSCCASCGALIFATKCVSCCTSCGALIDKMCIMLRVSRGIDCFVYHCCASRWALIFSLLLMLFEPPCLAMLFLRIAVRLAWQRCFGVSLPSVSLGNIVFCSCCTARRCPLPVHCKPPPHCPCIARSITLPDSPLPPSHVPRDTWREGGGGVQATSQALPAPVGTGAGPEAPGDHPSRRLPRSAHPQVTSVVTSCIIKFTVPPRIASR